MDLRTGEVQQLPDSTNFEGFIDEGAADPFIVSKENGITIRDAETDELISTLYASIEIDSIDDSPDTNRTPYFSEFVFSPDGGVLLGRSAGIVYVWDTQIGFLLWQISPDYVIEHITFSPDGRLIAVSCADGLVRLWGIPAEPAHQE